MGRWVVGRLGEWVEGEGWVGEWHVGGYWVLIQPPPFTSSDPEAPAALLLLHTPPLFTRLPISRSSLPTKLPRDSCVPMQGSEVMLDLNREFRLDDWGPRSEARGLQKK